MTGLAPPADPDRAAGPGRLPTASRLRRAAPALAAFAAVRLLGVLVLALWSVTDGKHWRTLLSARWDSLWYARIAAHGYGHTVRLPNGDVHSDLAFFPLLPWLERGLAALSPLSAADAGLVVSWTASLGAAAGLYAVGERLHGRRAGVLLAAVWAVVPVGVVESMAYSESLFTLLAVWGVYAVLTRRWVWAGALASLAGLTRPIGVAVVAAVWLSAAAVLWRERMGGGEPGLPGAPPARRRLLLGVALAPLGWCAYFVWVGVRTGSLTGYLDVQAGWRNGFDGGVAFASFVVGLPLPAALALTAGVAVLVWLYVRCVRRRQPVALLAYAGVVLLLALTARGYFGSKPRLMLPAFPLLLPIAAGLARWRPSRAAALIALVAVGSAVYGAFWLNGSGPP